MGVPEGARKAQKFNKIFNKMIIENFINLGKDMDIPAHEGQGIPIDPSRKDPLRGKTSSVSQKYRTKRIPQTVKNSERGVRSHTRNSA